MILFCVPLRCWRATKKGGIIPALFHAVRDELASLLPVSLVGRQTCSQAGFEALMTCGRPRAEIVITARICVLYGDFSGRSDTGFQAVGELATVLWSVRWPASTWFGGLDILTALLFVLGW